MKRFNAIKLGLPQVAKKYNADSLCVMSEMQMFLKVFVEEEEVYAEFGR